MRYAQIKLTDIANGTGVRISVFVQGCDFHCPGCFNPETWDFDGGEVFTNSCYEKIADQVGRDYISGVSILGGEPLHKKNLGTVIALCSQLRREFPSKSIWLYTGYEWEQLNAAQKTILKLIDVLVDGRFVEEQMVVDLRFKGSTNQRIIDVKKSLITGEVVLWND